MTNEQVLTVSALSSYIEEKFVRDPYLERVFIKGEISNSKLHSSGILYFTLKDESTTLRGIMFSNSVKRLKKVPSDGDGVIVEGRISVYKPGGYYQVIANDIVLDGQGQLYEKLEQNKKMLQAQGYFDPSHKKQLPYFPKTIILVTSATSAAYEDMIHAAEKRFPLTKIKVINTLMQGEKSIDSVINNLDYVDQLHADVVILARGGGSIEDLWTFNELEVAKKVFNMKTPIITAIGHETDTTLVDFVSDKRATTPTQAMEHALPDQRYLKERIIKTQLVLKKRIQDTLLNKQSKLESHKNYYKFRMPTRLYDQHLQQLVYKKDQLESLYNKKYNERHHQFSHLNYKINTLNPRHTIENGQTQNKQYRQSLTKLMQYKIEHSKLQVKNKLEILDSLNPLEILKRGYSFVSLDGHVLKSTNDVDVGDVIQVKLSDGRLETKITEVYKDE